RKGCRRCWNLDATCRSAGLLSNPGFFGGLPTPTWPWVSREKDLRLPLRGLKIAQLTHNGFVEAELQRLRGECLVMDHSQQQTSTFGDDMRNSAGEAIKCFGEAIEVAARQNAKSWELRATMSLARLLNNQGHREKGWPM